MRWALVLYVVAGCGGPEPPKCLEDLVADCTPQYEPTFTNVYTNTFARSCGVGGASCHAGDQASLRLDDEQLAYDHLVGFQVIAADAACSPLMERLERSGSGAMPPGAKLAAEERCAVQQWIDNGAPR
jgi:hypothetical protein